MSRFSFGLSLCLPLVFLMAASTVRAATLYVECGGKGPLTSIGAAVKVAKYSGPSTINVSGACRENVLIQNMDLLTIAGSKGASITDASGGTADVLNIQNSRVTITGMTIDGLSGANNDAVNCQQGSHRTLIGNTIQGDADCVGVYSTASAVIVGGVLQNGTSDGIFTFGDVVTVGVLIQGNPVGVVVRFGGRVRMGVVDPVSFPGFARTPTTIENNGAGVQVLQAQLACADASFRRMPGAELTATCRRKCVFNRPSFLTAPRSHQA